MNISSLDKFSKACMLTWSFLFHIQYSFDTSPGILLIMSHEQLIKLLLLLLLHFLLTLHTLHCFYYVFWIFLSLCIYIWSIHPHFLFLFFYSAPAKTSRLISFLYPSIFESLRVRINNFWSPNPFWRRKFPIVKKICVQCHHKYNKRN